MQQEKGAERLAAACRKGTSVRLLEKYIQTCHAAEPREEGCNTAGEYFSPEEVRAMSQRQVHENYRKILDSMKQW